MPPLYRRVNVTADAVVSATPTSLMGVLVNANNADWKLELTDSGSSTGTNVLELAGQLEGGQTFFDFSNFEGVLFPTTGIFCDLTGATHVTFWLK
ncbi:hypothetical protein LCGC14_0764940 [marine sediment metagenome]|uniref:Uncharacterized protein n=1 Tax=marine sediment metagenome TaxID=412755 RepID=A0A0F9Q090_9ZZZZ